jgi:Spy/CpxP family protein refolding chaperone
MNVLTPEQRTQVQQNMQQMRERRQHEPSAAPTAQP